MNVAMIPPIEDLKLPWACPQCHENAAAVRERARQNADFLGKLALLSERERQIMFAICAGEPPVAISQALNISTKTIATYRCRVMQKLELRTNVAIVVACERAGILER